ncbi:hypothetical protein EBR66_05925 [bacterium]|nr:hypothetical protein [bacterium]
MQYDYLMNISSALFFICYVPELYANYKNKNANIYNLPEKLLIVFGTGFAFSYAYINGDITLMTNYGSLLILDILACMMRAYYVYINNHRDVIVPELQA